MRQTEVSCSTNFIQSIKTVYTLRAKRSHTSKVSSPKGQPNVLGKPHTGKLYEAGEPQAAGKPHVMKHVFPRRHINK